ncbi:tRNA (N6-threonylcarbamoyladenosine(37)-N6)-methyltransferase TrmO [Desulfonatronovibrio hydrogenovorans]|uniref:tRNA (N6-threonylcarbamoyladenosine(37)-N6)-methyltransferase TrmO n=1 Tax=Desulfonatronovibrio hydrogenovorans TaxID=53245 RepID=UPI00048F5A4D|nr:tRNA (N6-threonylcarbamoyladenosine(37)-N6)-methyltransferase TrmO [Desulfonatronovibrio hydrogenovorans]
MKKINQFHLKTIGYADSSFKNIQECPFQGDEQCPPVRIRILPDYSQGLEKLTPGMDLIILTWLDRADRETLKCRPRNDPQLPVHGVFATRSPNRPNPIGLHQVRLLEMEDKNLLVHPLEVVDQTPVLDIKPVLRSKDHFHPVKKYFSDQEIKSLLNASARACSKGLLNGLNGNLSLKKQDMVLITSSGSAKGFLSIDHLCILDLSTGQQVAGNGQPSSEALMHLEIYRQQPQARAIAHTHPPDLLCLDGLFGHIPLENAQLFEAEAIRKQLSYIPGLVPGSRELAEAAGLKAKSHSCILMHAHGLTCWGPTLEQAVALCDEIEALARIELNSMLLKNIRPG